MKWIFVMLAILAGTCFGQVTCNLHTANNHSSGSIYVGNAAPGRFILIGTIAVRRDCLTSGFTFNASHIDSVNLNDHYEMSLYCISGKCGTPLHRVLDSGFLITQQFFPKCPTGDYLGGCALPDKKGNRPFYAPYGQAQEDIYWAGGTALLRTGNYALAMGTDCNSQTTPGHTDPYPGGGGSCGMGYGENVATAQQFDFKVFTSLWPTWKRCLVWNNGLPDTLCVMPVSNPTSGAPHMIDFALW